MARYLEIDLGISRFNSRGKSVVNYLVLNKSYVKNVTNFKVLPPNFNFEHAPITASFISSFVKVVKGKMLNQPKSSKWDNQGAIIFHSLLNPRKIQ